MGETAQVIELKHGDDDGGSDDELQHFVIDVATNGYVLTTIYLDDELKEVHTNIDDIFKAIKGKL